MDRANYGNSVSGAGLVWKWQRLLWWIFALNLIFAFFATQGMVDRLSPALDHSKASQYFVHGFDVSQMGALAGQPDSPLQFQGPTVIHFSVVFMILMLFFTGGILATYVRDERPAARVASRGGARAGAVPLSRSLSHRQPVPRAPGGGADVEGRELRVPAGSRQDAR